MRRTIKGSRMFGSAPFLVINKNRLSTWICIYDGDGRYLGNVEGVANLRKLADSILEALPPKRGTT